MPEEFKFYKLLMAGIVGWSAGLVAFDGLLEGDMQLYFCGIFSVVFWIGSGVYFYRKTHKKPEISKTFPPLAKQEIPQTKSKATSWKKILVNLFFITLEVVEASYFLSLITTWEIVRIPVDGLSIPIMTYQNGILSVLFVFGVFLALDLVRRIRHPRKAFFE